MTIIEAPAVATADMGAATVLVVTSPHANAVALFQLIFDAAEDFKRRGTVYAYGSAPASSVRLPEKGDLGIDVSHWQGVIDWGRVVADAQQVRFVVVRTGDGLTPDREFAANWPRAKNVGLPRGCYYYYRPELDPVLQADLFLERLGGDFGELEPWLDIEELTPRPPKVEELLTWLEKVEAITGRSAWIYTRADIWKAMGAPALTRYRLVVASYEVARPVPVRPWGEWAIWQFSKTGRGDGIEGLVDLDRWGPEVFEGGAEPVEKSVRVDVSKASALNVRTAPGTVGTAVLYTIGPNDGWLPVAEERAVSGVTWYKVAPPGKLAGWCSGSYLVVSVK